MSENQSTYSPLAVAIKAMLDTREWDFSSWARFLGGSATPESVEGWTKDTEIPFNHQMVRILMDLQYLSSIHPEPENDFHLALEQFWRLMARYQEEANFLLSPLVLRREDHPERLKWVTAFTTGDRIDIMARNIRVLMLPWNRSRFLDEVQVLMNKYTIK